MKNVIKKIAATAMAFTILGTGTAVTKSIAPQMDNSIVASAACHAHGQFVETAYEYRYDHTAKKWEVYYCDEGIVYASPGVQVWRKVKFKKCQECGKQWGSATKLNDYQLRW
ncbi:MAG: hypothetical protein IKW96_10095 [Ruminococcus sp.]|uniref:hypothetical protein n=1 Tax=Ruminococcus sp. TaxID=41978 RepID=UPI0025E2D0D2|nr:hypothetical protein [Ruminococcus sp.]MBR5683602.1 hypothetical protein [Ruminococcus sp.]